MLVATFHCTRCGAEGDLRSPTCFGNVLKAFVDEVQIDSVVLADMNHRQYSGALVEVMRRQANLVREFERAALRAGSAAGTKNAKCASCPMLPSRVFLPTLERIRTAGTSSAADATVEFEGSLREAKVPTSHPECAGCVALSQDVALHLADQAREGRARLSQAAYKVSEASS